MLEVIFGNRTAQIIFIRLFIEDAVSAGVLARDFDKSVSVFQNQLERLENGGLLVSRKIGNIRLFTFNPQSSYINPLKKLIEVEYQKLGVKGREYFFPKRRMRPRKRGKEILKEEEWKKNKVVK